VPPRTTIFVVAAAVATAMAVTIAQFGFTVDRNSLEPID
jgi:hypothetical protein